MRTLIAIDPCRPPGEPQPGLMVRLGADGVTFEEVRPFTTTMTNDDDGNMRVRYEWDILPHIPASRVASIRNIDAPNQGPDHG